MQGQYVDSVNWRGHHQSKNAEQWFLDQLQVQQFERMSNHYIRQLEFEDRLDSSFDAFKQFSAVKLKNNKVKIQKSPLNVCFDCGDELGFTVDLKKRTAKTLTQCKYEDGFPVYSARINVSSGKLVIANDLREFLDVEEKFDCNTNPGTKAVTDAYAKQNMIHIYVGNSSPEVFQNGNTINIGCLSEDKKKPRDIGKRIGMVNTRLWWYSAMDLRLAKVLNR